LSLVTWHSRSYHGETVLPNGLMSANGANLSRMPLMVWF